MIDTDFIYFTKWKVGYAEGFKIELFNGHEIIDYHGIMSCPISGIDIDLAMSPLLLQKAIEKINTSYGDDRIRLIPRYSIAQKRWCYRIERHGATIWHTDWYDLIDDAKDAVLKHVYEQEKINENK